MAKREPKTIEEARTLILSAVPNDTWVWLSASWSDHRDGGASFTRVTYRCSIKLAGQSDALVVESHLVAQLCRLAIAAMVKAGQPLGLPPARRPRPKAPAVASHLKGSVQPRLTLR